MMPPNVTRGRVTLEDLANHTSGSQNPVKKPPIGSGERFRQLKEKLAKRGDVRNPGAVAAAAGRAKFGSKRFAQLAAKGRRRAAKARAGKEG